MRQSQSQEVEGRVNKYIRGESSVNALNNNTQRKTQSKRLTKKRLPTVEPSVVNRVDNIIATVTLPNEQVESYEIRKVGEANIVTKCYDDGTSASFIVSCSDDELSSQLIALN